MADSTIKLYYGTAQHPWMLTANKFFVIDNISDYLSTYSTSCTTFNNFQYIKCGLEIAIVCDLAQTYSEPLLKNGIKYVSIKNSDAEKTYYYYVKKAEWRGKQSVKLYLVMDVANTFRSGTDFNFTERTKITREHKNRFVEIPSYFDMECEDIVAYGGSDGESGYINNEEWISSVSFEPEEIEDYEEYGGVPVLTYIYDADLGRNLNPSEYWDVAINISYFQETGEMVGDFFARTLYAYQTHTFYFGFTMKVYDSHNKKYVRKIDYQSEGLTPVLYKKNEHLIERAGLLNRDWYLLYRNQNEPTEALTNPVECYLIPSEETPVNVGSIQEDGRINPENLEYGKYYYFSIYLSRLNQSDWHRIVLSNGEEYKTLYIGANAFEHYTFLVYKVADDKIMVFIHYVYQDQSLQTINEFRGNPVVDYFNIEGFPFPYQYSTTKNISGNVPAGATSSSWTEEGTSPLMLDGIEKLDRTDAKNIKLIKLPYIPYNLQEENNKLIITDTDFEHVSLTQTGGGIIEILKLKNLNIKFNYDFFIGLSPLEDINLTMPTITANTLRNDYLESKIFHSDYYQPKFVYDSFGYVFQLERFDLDYIPQISNMNNMKIKYVVSTTITSKFMFQFIDYKSVLGKEDYNNVMPIARNNEMVLYNVPYINYIRTGYNYDVKNKNSQAFSSWASVGLSGLSMATALAFPTTTLKIAGVVASLVSTAIAIKNAAVNQAQAERNLDQKMLEAKNQSTSVSGSDDVDLMSVYTENRAKMCTYECSDIMKELMLDLFFYTGYVSNRMGLPNTNTRLNFDYLEADIIITDTTNMSDEIMNELVGLYKNGLTFIHKVATRTDMWDVEQKYENIETFMIQ